MLAIVCAVTTGYIAFASFIVSQVIWILTVIGFYFLLRVFTEELVEKLPARESKASLFLQTNIGLRRRSVEQLSVLTAGAINIVLLIIAILLIIAPWGMERTIFTRRFRPSGPASPSAKYPSPYRHRKRHSDFRSGEHHHPCVAALAGKQIAAHDRL